MKRKFTKYNFKKILTITLSIGVIITTLISSSNVKASSYVYDYWKNVIPSTEGLTYKETYYNKDIKSILNESISLNNFNKLIDMDVDGDKIYVLDQNETASTEIHLASGTVDTTKNSYLMVIDQNFRYEKIVNHFIISDEVRAKLDEFYHFSVPLDEITTSQVASGEFVDVYEVNDETEKVENGLAHFLTFEYDEETKNNRGVSLKLYTNDELIDESKYTYEKADLIAFTEKNVDEDPSKNLSMELIEQVLKSISLENYIITETEVTLRETLNGVTKNNKYQQYRVVCTYGDAAKVSEAVANLYKTLKGSKTLTQESSVVTNIKFNDSSFDQKDVRAIHKYIQTQGRAPYLPYYDEETGLLDFTKACVYLNNAQGVTIANGFIYIADTDNARILKLNKDFVVVDVILTPDDSAFYQMYNSGYETEYGTAYETIASSNSDNVMFTKVTSDQQFQPLKVAVMDSGVVYCVASNIYEGILEFSNDTSFNRYLGSNEVAADAWKKFWSIFLNDDQLKKLALSLPPMFNNITVASNGFLYATSNPDTDSVTSTKMVKIVNTKGKDILKRNGYVSPDGDAVYLRQTTRSENIILGSSILTDVAISKTGNYTVVDEQRGRLFTYDSEGNLLYIAGEQPGGISNQGSGNGLSHCIIKPVAINYLYRLNEQGEEEETLVVLDQYSKSILLFETTEFGKAVNEATSLYQQGIIVDTYLVDEEERLVTIDENNNYAVIENGKVITDTTKNNIIRYNQEAKKYDIYDNNDTLIASIAELEVKSGEGILIQKGAESYWRQVIKMNTNYELAYLGIGKALNRRGEYKEAMANFKLAHNSDYYSKAFSSYRDQVLNENFNLLMTTVIAVVALFVIANITKRILKKEKANERRNK